VSCVHKIAPGPDLSGSIACGEMTCGSGQLCVDFERDGSDGSADPIDEYSCRTPDPGCPLVECNGSCADHSGPDCCPMCIIDLCGPIGGYDGERSVSCYGF